MTKTKLKEPYEVLDCEAKEFCVKHWGCEIIDDMSSAYYDIHIYEETTADDYSIWVAAYNDRPYITESVYMYDDSLEYPILETLRTGGTLKISDYNLDNFEGNIIDWQDLYAGIYEELTNNNDNEN